MSKRDNAFRRKPAPTLIKSALHIFTDGSCCRKSRQGGWGTILMWGDNAKHIYGGCAEQTNNTMELTAILEGLRARKRDVATIVYSDSQYSINAVTLWHHSWRKRGWITSVGAPVKNVPLIEAVTDLITPNVRFQWVRGHNGHVHNEAADKLAYRGRKEFGSCQEMQQSIAATFTEKPQTM